MVAKKPAAKKAPMKKPKETQAQKDERRRAAREKVFQKGTSEIYSSGNMRTRVPGTRVTKYSAEVVKKICDTLAEGLSITSACAAGGIERKTYYLWLEHHAEFKELVGVAEEAGTDKLEEAALRRAMHGVTREVYHKDEVVGSYKVYSDLLTIFLLKGRRPKKWGSHLTEGQQTPTGAPSGVTINFNTPTPPKED